MPDDGNEPTPQYSLIATSVPTAVRLMTNVSTAARRIPSHIVDSRATGNDGVLVAEK